MPIYTHNTVKDGAYNEINIQFSKLEENIVLKC